MTHECLLACHLHPQSLENMNFLRVLYLDDNDFTGVIGPDFLHDHPMLLRVDLSANEFNGSFPGHLFDNSIGLQVLDIHDNWLNGPIDTDFSYHPNMLLYVLLYWWRMDTDHTSKLEI